MYREKQIKLVGLNVSTACSVCALWLTLVVRRLSWQGTCAQHCLQAMCLSAVCVRLGLSTLYVSPCTQLYYLHYIPV
jgi:hypothetical protein